MKRAKTQKDELFAEHTGQKVMQFLREKPVRGEERERKTIGIGVVQTKG